MSDALQLRDLLQRTPARLFTGRAGMGYPTALALQLRAEHAAARDAVYQEVDLLRDFGPSRVEEYGLFEVQTQAASHTEYLLRPDRGRLFNCEAEQLILNHCPTRPELQFILGDGLSANAMSKHGAKLLDLAWKQAAGQNWKLGRPLLVRFCRVGILNEIGRLLQPEVCILLIGERPGLAQSESLSAYLAYQPRPGHTDAQRNVISNIHPRGVTLEVAVERMLHLASCLRQAQGSGVAIKESLPIPAVAAIE